MTRRADRLFAVVQLLRRGKLVTAKQLGERLEVSERTIYRDIADLQASGVPIDGEAGVGYLLRAGFDLPPLMFSREEVEALVVGARLVKTFVGAGLGRGAEDALAKIEHVLPDGLKRELERSRLFVPEFLGDVGVQAVLDQLRQAINQKNVVQFGYQREDGMRSERAVEPLGLFCWGRTWTLAGWCELRNDFRHFRVDRINALVLTERKFEEVAGRSLSDFFRAVEAQETTRKVADG